MPLSLVGARIRDRRKIQKLTQAKLAGMAGISPSYLNLIEHNRRGIAGRTLQAIAAALDTTLADLSEEADQIHLNRIKQAAAKNAGSKAEINRTEEFTGRFPGFSKLLITLFDSSENQNQTLLAMSDKLNNDPFFAEAMHLMLSNITVIRSTADILQSGQEIPTDLRDKFLSNLLVESERMSETAQDVLNHFAPTKGPLGPSENANPVEAFFQKRGYYIAELETDGVSPSELASAENSNEMDTNHLRQALVAYRTMAQHLQLDMFIDLATGLKFDPVSIAIKLNAPLTQVFRRMAHLPAGQDLPEYALLEIDGSGAVLFRKQISSLALPQYSSACPIWPIYRSLSTPHQPIQSMLDMPTGERFLTYSIAGLVEQGIVGVPGLLNASMLITNDAKMLMTKQQLSSIPKLPAGMSCSVCPRKECLVRRSDYILA